MTDKPQIAPKFLCTIAAVFLLGALTAEACRAIVEIQQSDQTRLDEMERLSQGRTVILNADITNIDQITTSKSFWVGYSTVRTDDKDKSLRIKERTNHNDN